MEIHIPNNADDSASSLKPTVARRWVSEEEWKHIQNVIRAKDEKIARLENFAKMSNHSSNSASEKDEKIARLENLIQQLECKVDELAKKIAFYESPNMASSTPSMYNTERNNFRKTYGSPEQPAPQKQNDNDNTSSKSEEDAKNASDDTSNTKHDRELPYILRSRFNSCLACGSMRCGCACILVKVPWT